MRKPLLLILTILGLVIGWAQINYTYHYWFGNDYDGGVDGSLTNESSTVNVDIGSLPEGVHAIHFQISEGDTLSSVKSCFFFKSLDLSNGITVNAYIDNILWSSQKVTTNNGVINLDLDVENLSVSLHTLMVQAASENGVLSSTYTTMFFRQPSYKEGSKLQLYIDEKFHSEYDLSSSSEIITLDVDIADLNVGLHTLLAQTFSSDGTPSSPHSQYFFKQPTVSSGGMLNIYIDEKLQDSRQVSSNDGLIALNFDVNSLPIGLHILRAQIKGDDNIWSSSFSRFFLRVPSDEDYENMTCYYTFYIPDEEGNVTYDYGTFKKGGTYADGGFSFDADVSELEHGNYNILCALVLPDGTVSSIETASFLRVPTDDFVPSEYPEITNLKAATSLSSGVVLTWDGVEDAFDAILADAIEEGYSEDKLPFFAGYNVYRNGDSEALNSSPLDVSTYKDTSLDLLVPNYYSVSAVYQLADESLHETEPSDTVHAMQRLEKPSIRYASRQIYIEGSYPENTQIYYAVYTSQQSNPDVKVDGAIYQDPFTLTSTSYVYALATLDGYFDSEVSEYSYVISNVTCGAPTISVEGVTVTLASATENAVIYYTLDDTEPSSASTQYSSPFNLTENCTIKAIAVRDDYFDSSVSSKVIDTFKCAAPTISVNADKVTITCETDGASIYYTLDGTSPTSESKLYSDTFSVNENCTVKAIAIKENFNDSEVASAIVDSFQCSTPIISVKNGQATITCETEGATIHYTLDGTEPTESSAVYSSPVAVSGVCTIKAIAVKANFNNSEVATYNYDENSVTCVAPVISVSGSTVTITSDTEGASIYYTLDGTTPSSASTLYAEPFTVSENCTIKAIAVRDDYFDSSVSSKVIDTFKCAAPTISVNADKVTITCETEGASIYYTLDGTSPTSESKLYSDTFSVNENCTVKAIAIKENFNDSEVASTIVDSFQCSTPIISVKNGQATITCETEGATIHYTLNGTEPTESSAVYSSPVAVSGVCTIKAIAVKANFNNSEVATYNYDENSVTCVAPVISVSGSTVTITSDTEGASIYYTLDGKTPSSASTLYAEPFTVSENCTIKAIAVMSGYFDSDVTTKVIDTFQCAKPTISVKDGKASMACETEGATIHYTLDGTEPTESSAVYSSPVAVSGVCTIKAIAVKDNFNNSEVATYNYDENSVTCVAPVISVSGSTVTITSDTEGASIYYTLDGTTPSSASTLYAEPFTVSENCTIKAIAVMSGYFDSDVTTKVIDTFQCSKPTISVKDGKASMACETEGATIHYTLDGTEPTESSAVYSSPVAVSGVCTIKAIAVKDNFNNSEVATYNYDENSVTCVAPVISVSGSTVTITSDTEGASIYYTLDGKTPSSASTLYAEPFTVSENCTIKAIAVMSGYFDSDVTTKVIDTFQCAKPTISVKDGKASMACETEGATIHYTLDGTEPTESSAVYSSPVAVSGVCTIKAIAVKENFNNSEVATYNYDENSVTCVAPVISVSGSTVTITSDTDGASIYYTLDGTTPSSASTLYAEPFTVSENCTINAIAVMSGYFDSDVTTKVIDTFQCAKPTISVKDGKASMACETEGATIHYTLDGTEPTESSVVYSSPVAVSGVCTIKAIAVKENFNNSEVATYNYDENSVTCVAPGISVSGSTVTITSDTEGASIYYTLDGTTPSSASTLYAEPFTVSENCTIKAIAVMSGYFDSDVTTKVIDTFQCAKPTFALVGEDMVEISCATDSVRIYYNIGSSNDPDKSSTLYEGPFQIADNSVIKARAYKENLNPSEVASYAPNAVECEAPTFGYDGRYATIKAADGAAISYTLDDGETMAYSAPFDIENAKTIKAWASMENFNDSEVTVYDVPAYFDGETATVNEAGQLNAAFQWAEAQLADIAWIRLQGAANEDDAEQLSALTNLGAVIWEWDDLEVPAGLLTFNPNMLLYVSSSDLAANSGLRNVVVNGYADAIELDESGNFYCPEAFTAYEAKYTHSYSMTTALEGDTQGWETLVLPFDVQTVTHLGNSGTVTAKGEIRPFAAFAEADYSEAKPFWLYGMNGSWQAASEIEAYTPYVISMPNNPYYATEFILAGEVEFAADNAIFPSTQAAEAPCGTMRLVGTTMRLQQDAALAPINRYDDSMGYAEGSAFVPELRDVEPFEAYLTDASGSRMNMPVRLADLGWNINGIPSELVNDELWRVYSYDGILYISTSVAQRVVLYSMAGQALRVLDLVPGVNEVYDLTTGIYVLKNSKVFVEMKHLN